MRVELELWQLISLLIAFLGCVAGFGKIILNQLDQRLDIRFKAQDEARAAGAATLRDTLERYAKQAQETASQLTELERRFLEFKAELPLSYVRREDYVRGQTVIEAKLDALYSELKYVQIKGGVGDGR